MHTNKALASAIEAQQREAYRQQRPAGRGRLYIVLAYLALFLLFAVSFTEFGKGVILLAFIAWSVFVLILVGIFVAVVAAFANEGRKARGFMWIAVFFAYLAAAGIFMALN